MLVRAAGDGTLTGLSGGSVSQPRERKPRAISAAQRRIIAERNHDARQYFNH